MRSKADKLRSRYQQKYKDVNALVFGATGFIGRWAARLLSASGANLSLPVRDKAAAQVIFEKYNIRGQIYELDYQNFAGLQELIHELRPTIVFNLAGYGINRNEQSEETAYLINVHLVEVVCAAIAETGKSADWTGQQIVHAGSAMEYGAISGNLDEDSIPEPTTLYAKSKLAGTLALTRCCREYDLKGLTARLFAVYGEGELPARLLPTLIKAALTNDSIELTEGLHKRDFTYVEDAAEGLLRLGLASPCAGDVVNIATGSLTSIRSFTETAAEVLGIAENRLKFGALPTRPEEMKHQPVTVERLHKLTGWTPKTTIADGIRKTLNFERTPSTNTPLR